MSKLISFLSSSALFATPSFSKGASRVADLFGYLDNYNYKETEPEADLEALKRDWNMVGVDIANAMETYEIDDHKTDSSFNTQA